MNFRVERALQFHKSAYLICYHTICGGVLPPSTEASIGPNAQYIMLDYSDKFFKKLSLL